MSDLFAAAIFCDDIRLEIGNKLTFVGAYDRDLFVSQFPATLPKLCFFVSAFAPAGRARNPMTVRILMDERVISELMSDPATIAAHGAKIQPDEVTGRARVSVAIISSNFVVPAPCHLRVEVLSDGETFQANGLDVALVPDHLNLLALAEPGKPKFRKKRKKKKT